MSQSFDLENSHIVIGSGHEDTINRWQTSVECVLSRTNSHDEKQYAWLSHECRSEHLSPHIFDDEYYEFVVVKGWNGTVYLRGGSYNYGFNPIKNFLGEAPQTTHENGDLGVEVYCKERKARKLGFDEALEFFQKEDENKTNKIYMAVEYEKGSHKYELLAPCRYTNYPHSSKNEKYLQPISGYVLFEDQERFFLSYVAAHIRKDGTKSIEFRVREMTSFINTKNKRSRLYRVFKLLDFLFLRFFFVTDDFTRTEKVHNAKCTLFVYDD